MKLEIVVPCYNEEKNIEKFFNEINDVLKDIDFNIIFVNDGSSDNTLEKIKKLNNVNYISFSRNFGKEAAIYAGLQKTTADYVILMDADLQDPSSLIPEMIEYIDDYDIVATRRVSRKGEPKIRSFFARKFYKIMNAISQTEIVDGAQDFRFMTRQMVDAILDMSEYNRFSKGIFSWVGFRVKYMPYENVERPAGTTSWSFWGLFKYSLEGIMAFSTAPLAVASLLGIISCVVAFILIVFTILKAIIGFGETPAGYMTIICVVFLFSGLQLLCTGVLGQYLAKTYLETKHRPIYIAGETDETYRAKKQENEGK